LTSGLIVVQPFASLIASGKKKIEYRNYKPPKHYVNVPIYILSQGKVHAKVLIKNWSKVNNYDSVVIASYGDYSYAWDLRLIESYDPPIPYSHPNGAQKWVKMVTLK
jgi:hypothetical protein